MHVVPVRTLQQQLRAQCEALVPECVPLPEVVELFGVLDQIARLAAGAKLRLLHRLDEAQVAARDGDRSTADWVARITGTTVGAARDSLDASNRLREQPATEEAVASGELSEEQAKAVSDAAGADPAAEERFVEAAKRDSVKELKDRCAKVKAAAHTDPAARREAVRRGRYLRTFRDGEGGWNLHVRHLPEVGAEIEELLASFTHGRFEAARRAGEREAHEAHSADALLDLARGAHRDGRVPGGARRAETKVIVHVDIDALLRGRTEPGSTCHVDGVGPVDVDWVRSVYGEAFAAAVLHETVGVRAVVHLGRQVTAHQRTALEARGHCCEVPGCGATYALEIDHVDDWALTRQTTLDQLAWLCPHHHGQKTHRGYRLHGPPGARTWTAPGGARRSDSTADLADPTVA